ncbi:DoxX family protein [Nocardioides sp. B-3]|uniref:DoxX family protein n=1 Tax=Nocardioides sp. B-3 TaxID=2895565 RepID=UPI002153A4E5|nr:DoxX family protein [Nocardioides sp. B-3]UUZ58501.1 DoxX family protein [Nocardioides sp. B-3]
MTIIAIILAVLLAVVLTSSGIAKLKKSDQIVESLTKAGVPLSLYPFLAAVEIAGAIGLVWGIWWTPIGVAAAIGVVLYFVGAIVFHLRAKDTAIVPPAVPGTVAAAAGVTLALA